MIWKSQNLSLISIENLIRDFEGPSTDSCCKRAYRRLMHITFRIQRISIDGASNLEKEFIRKWKNEALKLEAELFDHV